MTANEDTCPHCGSRLKPLDTEREMVEMRAMLAEMGGTYTGSRGFQPRPGQRREHIQWTTYVEAVPADQAALYTEFRFKDPDSGIDRQIVLPTYLAYRLVTSHIKRQVETNKGLRPLSAEEESILGGLRKVDPRSLISDDAELHRLWEKGIIAENYAMWPA